MTAERVTGEGVDHVARAGVCAKKNARDPLICLLASHPLWAVGFEDETWWSGLAHPAMHAWTSVNDALHLIEHTVCDDDPDPQALAYYGMLVRDADVSEETWLRFLDGRPLSVLPIPFLVWCCARCQAGGKTALLLV